MIFHLITTILAKSRLIPFIWAIKMAATASYRAVPSILMVAPTGSMNLVTLTSTPHFSSKHLMVTGRVAELKLSTVKKMSYAQYFYMAASDVWLVSCSCYWTTYGAEFFLTIISYQHSKTKNNFKKWNVFNCNLTPVHIFSKSHI